MNTINIIDLANTPTVLSVKDIQPKFDNAFTNQNKIRLAWKLQISAAEQAKMTVLAQDVKHSLYQAIDRDVRELYIQYLKDYMKAVMAEGAELRMTKDGWPILEASYQIDCDVFLIHAATAVLSRS